MKGGTLGTVLTKIAVQILVSDVHLTFLVILMTHIEDLQNYRTIYRTKNV